MGTSMPDGGNVQWIDKRSPGAIAAVQEFERISGFSMSVFSDDHWRVVSVDGRIRVMINHEGMRALATFAPDPERAHRITDQIMEIADRRRGERP